MRSSTHRVGLEEGINRGEALQILEVGVLLLRLAGSSPGAPLAGEIVAEQFVP